MGEYKRSAIKFTNKDIGVWFPTIRTGTGTDKFTEQLVKGLNEEGVRAEITWLPHYAEYLPWLIKSPVTPKWANIVHINTWLPSKFYPKEFPIVATLHHCVQDKNFYPYKTKLQKLYHYLWITPIEKESILQATALTTVSEYTAMCAKEIFYISNIEVIYNGIDFDIFNTKSCKKKLDNKNFRLLFVGSNSIRKGFDLLPKIMEELGEGYELFYTSNTPNMLPLNMKKLPYQETAYDLANTYRSMDALLFPSRLEGFGLVVAEAMACGLPVVVANSSALPEIIENKVSGFICQKDNISDFVNTVKCLKNNKELQKEISNAASIHIQENFNIKHTINSYITLYQKLIIGS
ncbi:hypothetical protein AY606_10405 [Acinetobacter sp. SFB]|uniref:glycosyltransferase family 4 protein n=1 Tax=Acinetobacter sp. SFB TaxID=1805634 RepID=UPI0007D83A3C|nr:glycosyltransferase family 4 protein [Acinetobacter sp. SFB]OAL77853.1 hypothetical protein AY606_10405 [Acinetobacter sp. SFB]